jgi:hypothetical protein
MVLAATNLDSQPLGSRVVQYPSGHVVAFPDNMSDSEFATAANLSATKEDPEAFAKSDLHETLADFLLSKVTAQEPESRSEKLSRLLPSDVTGEICTKWNERESTWRKSGSCQSRGTSQSRS